MTAAGRRSDVATQVAARRPAAAFVLLLMLVGCLLLWIGVPTGAMWVASKLTDSFGVHMPAALMLSIIGMLAVAAGLAWLNDLFLRITGSTSLSSSPPHRGGPLEPMLIACLVAAIAAFAVWFLVLAENPTVNIY